MPTIELARLKIETAQLADLFSEPAEYVRGVVQLLRQYTVPVHRQGKVKSLRTVLPHYEVPPPLMKHLQFEMTLKGEDAPEEALRVADQLWAEPSIETRQLAARLLGSIDVSPAEVTGRLEAWAQENLEQILVPELGHEGLRGLAAKHPEQLLDFADRLLDSQAPRKQNLSLVALLTLLTTTNYDNLPPIFKLMTKAMATVDRGLRPEVVSVLVVLAERSAPETEFMLQECLSGSATESISWIVRHAINALPEDSRARLRPKL
jgi:hypothetical protein